MKDNRPMGIYVHVPFCNKKCDYCDFVSYTMDEKAQDQYIDAVCNEIELIKRDFQECTFNTIYIGGGTPSILPANFISKLTRKLYSSFHFDEYVEYTIEVNPMSFSREKFLEYVKCGINRISVGVQCLNEAVLKKIGRIQTNNSVTDTFNLITKSAFLNVSADVIIGLPSQSMEDVKRTVDFLIDNDVKHISVYSLQVEEGTKLCNSVKANKVKPLSEEKQIQMYNAIYNQLTKAGFIRYELSNYCVPGYASMHNQKYWEHINYLGLGVAAHSFVENYRYQNSNNLEEYINLTKQNKRPVVAREYITDKTRRTERIMLSLRTSRGINLEQFKADFNEDLLRSKSAQIKKLKDMGMLEVVNGNLRITKDYFNVSNSIILELI